MNKTIVLLLAVATLFSCKKPENHIQETTQSSTHHDHTDHEGHDHTTNHNEDGEHHEEVSTTEKISLDNGKKWTVNPEMKPFIENGEKLLYQFISGQKTDYPELAKNLAKENDQLIKSCTMKGKSHDELHVWLLPHLQLVESLEKTKDNNEGKMLTAELEKSYLTYHQYFQ